MTQKYFERIPDIDGHIIQYLSTLLNSEHYYYLQMVPSGHIKTLLHRLMVDYGYDKFIPKTLAEEMILEELKPFDK